MPAVASLSDVWKYYGSTPALAGLSLSVRRGEVFGLFGPNGAGKTTTIRVLTGMTRPSAGHVRVVGHDLAVDHTEFRQCLGIVPDIPSLYARMRYDDYLEFFGRMAGLSRPERRARAKELVEVTDMEDALRKPLGHMSVGQRQRAEISRALLGDPEILFLDEPFTGIDLEHRRTIRAYLRRWVAEGHAVLSVSHNIVESELYVDRFAFIVRGRLVALGRADELKHHRLSPRYRVVVSDTAGAVAALSGRFFVQSIVEKEGYLDVQVSSRERVADIAPLLVAAKVGIYELSPTGTMEDVFDTVTREGGAG